MISSYRMRVGLRHGDSLPALALPFKAKTTKAEAKALTAKAATVLSALVRILAYSPPPHCGRP